MAPPRKRTSDLGEALRAAREALRLDQRGLAQRIHVSPRVLSRWENGGTPGPGQARDLFDALSPAPEPVVRRLAAALGIELADDDETVAIAGPPAAPEPPPPLTPPPRPTTAAMRAAFDAVIYAAAEDRDLLPRHLRAVAVELFQVAHRLGIDAREAAQLVGMAERGEGKRPEEG